MTDHRIRQSIQERFDVDFNRHGKDPLLAWRRRATWFCGLATLVIVGGLHWTGNRRIYESRPVSRAHQSFENKCHVCHDTSWQPLRRVFLGDVHARSVSEHACRECHPNEHTHDHSPVMIQSEVRDCIECHREHHGKHSLVEVADRRCTQCHAELETTAGPADFATSVTSFAEHPEFFLLDATRKFRAESRHGATQLVSKTDGQQRPLDAAQLRFNHALHLAPQGLPAPATYPDRDSHATTVQLDCASCHELDDAGRYMRPVNYEAHCSQCHQLHFDARLAEIDPALQLQAALPHGDPQVIRDLLRSRLLSFAERYPDRLLPDEDESRLPHKVRPSEDASDPPPPDAAAPAGDEPAGDEPAGDELAGDEPVDGDEADAAPLPATAEQKLQWVNDQLREIERFVFEAGRAERVSSNRLDEAIQAGCAHCHVVEPPDEDSSWTIVPPRIPERWMPHARFRHDRHDTIQCTQCHYREGKGQDTPVTNSPDSIYSSRATTDILMPSIATCRQCHGATGGTPGSRGARADCVMCHAYHHDNQSSQETLSLEGRAGYADREPVAARKP